MIKTFIVEDEKEALEYLSSLLDESNIDIDITGTASSVEDAVKGIEEKKPDLVFMDINLPDGTGFDVLEKLNYKDFFLIFVTAFDDYAIKAFRFNAIDYLLKPIDPNELNKALSKVKKIIDFINEKMKIEGLLNFIKQPEKNNQILVNTSDNLYVLKLDDILYLKSESNYTKFFTTDESDEIIVSRTLKEYDEILKDKNFIRTHNSYLVNLNWISRIIKKENVVELKNGAKVPISARKKEIVVKELNKHIGG